VSLAPAARPVQQVSKRHGAARKHSGWRGRAAYSKPCGIYEPKGGQGLNLQEASTAMSGSHKAGIRFLLVLLAISLLLSGVPRQGVAQAGQSPISGLEGYIQKSMRDWNVPGLGIAIVKDDKVVLAKGFGVRKLGEAAPVDESTLFAIGSTSKAFTAAAVSMLVDEGKVDWDAPVTKYLSKFQLSDPYVTRQLKVRDLFCHRVGIDRGDDIWLYAEIGRDEILRRARYLPQIEGFRYAYGYNNIMYLAAGQLIEAVTGETWDEFVRKRIFNPLGMADTNTSVTSLQTNRDVATPHQLRDGVVSTVPWRNIDNVAPAGAINSSATDMAAWLRLQLASGAFNGKQVLSSSAITEMRTPHNVIPYPGVDNWESELRPFWPAETHFMLYGLGWFLEDYRGREVIWHGGSIDGMTAMVAIMPEENLGVVTLANLNGLAWCPLHSAILLKIFDAYLGVPERNWSAELRGKISPLVEKEEARRKTANKKVEGTHPSLPLEKYAGDYKDCLIGSLKVVYESGKLAIRGAVYQGPLEHWQYDTFQVSWKDPRTGGTPQTSFVTFSLNSQGSVDGLRFSFRPTRTLSRVPDGTGRKAPPDPCD
jgi:CubicO group peptidase (beta-lactamase class C family)